MNRRTAAFSILGAVACLASGRAEDDGERLIRGDDPGQFELFGIAPGSIRVQDGEVRLLGKPFGLFATRGQYQDFTLTFEWMFERPDDLVDDARFRGNSGVILQLTPPLAAWPKGVEVQLAQADPGSIFPLGDARFEGKSDPEAQRRAVKAVGAWNRSEITARAGTILSVLNGVEVARGVRSDPVRGPIAWQSEGKPIRFRAIRIRPIG